MDPLKKYISVFLITASIFAVAFFISSSLGDKRVDFIKSSADKLSLDILSLETQFEIFQDSSCESLSESILASDLAELGRRLNFMESDRGADDEEVINLKKYYSLLEIKDYLIMKKVGERCGAKPLTILYFYSNTNCEDCAKQGYVLTKLQEYHPDLRIYTFDYNLDLNAMKALIAVHKVAPPFPVMVVDGITLNGFMDLEALEGSTDRLASSTRVVEDESGLMNIDE
jgi:hypothetical protein